MYDIPRISSGHLNYLMFKYLLDYLEPLRGFKINDESIKSWMRVDAFFSRSYSQPSVLYWMCLIEFQPSNAHRCCRHSTAAWSTAAAISSAIRSSSRVTAISCWSERRHWRALLTDPGLIHPLTVSRLTCRHSIRNQYTSTENHLNSLKSSIKLLTKQTFNFNEL